MGLFITKYLQTLSHFVRITKCHFLHTIWISYILKNMWTCTHTHLHAHMHTLIYKQYIGQKGLLFIIFMVLLKLFETQMSLLFPVVITLAFTDQCREKVQNIHDEEAICKCFFAQKSHWFCNIHIFPHIFLIYQYWKQSKRQDTRNKNFPSQSNTKFSVYLVNFIFHGGAVLAAFIAVK